MSEKRVGRKESRVYCAYCGREWAAGEVRGHQIRCREERGGVPVWGVGSGGVGEGKGVAVGGVGAVAGEGKRGRGAAGEAGKGAAAPAGVKKEVVYEAFEE